MEQVPLRLIVNGDPRELPPCAHLAAAVEALDLHPAAVLVEINGSAPPRSEWPDTPVRSGDRLEILRVAAGG